MLDEILDVLRSHGWSETGPSHDAVRWLREEFEVIDDLRSQLLAAEEAQYAAEREQEEAETDAETAKEDLAAANARIDQLLQEVQRLNGEAK